jgi:hypothetical protein
MFDPLAQMIPILEPLPLSRSKELDDRLGVLQTLLQIVPHHSVSGTREGQQGVLVELQHPCQVTEDRRGGDAGVYLDVEAVLRADGGPILFSDLSREARQDQPTDWADPQSHGSDSMFLSLIAPSPQART